jgi:hypothetical protein
LANPAAAQVEPIDEGLDGTQWVLRADMVVERPVEEEGLRAIMAGDVHHGAILAHLAAAPASS